MLPFLALALAAAPADDVNAAIDRMVAAEASSSSVRCVFHRREYVDGELLPQQNILVEWRRGVQTHMKWLAGSFEGRELWWNHGAPTMKVQVTSFLALDLDPDGSIARDGERHSAKQAGMAYTVHQIASDRDRVRGKGTSKTEVLGARIVNGLRSFCWRSEQPKDAGLYAERAEICVDDKTSLPTVVRVWRTEDGAQRLVEDYSYSDIVVN